MDRRSCTPHQHFAQAEKRFAHGFQLADVEPILQLREVAGDSAT